MRHLGYDDFQAFKELIDFPKHFGWCWGWRGTSSSWAPSPNHPEESVPRWAYRLYVDPGLPDNVDVRRQCGNSACVNPDHLAPGTERRRHLHSKERGELIRSLAGREGSFRRA